ncbi:hypothetical protein LCGC14_3061740, partial [marine sediment metagenome]
MGAGCRRTANRETVFVGGYCENTCFANHGGCEASSELDAVKTDLHCELKPDSHEPMVLSIAEMMSQIDSAGQNRKSTFLYTPDMFSKTYFRACFLKMPDREGSVSIAINAGVRTLVDSGCDWTEIRKKGITEVWLGVESATKALRDKYCKPDFTNAEVVKLTREGREAGIDVCWYLVDGLEDTDETRLATLQLIKDGDPFRIHIGDI